MLVSMPLRFKSNSLLGEALPFAGEDPQLAQGRRRWLPGGQGAFQAQATEQAGIELVRFTLLLRALSKVLDFVWKQHT